MGCRHLTDLISFSSVEAIDQTIAPLNKSEGEKINHQFINNIILSERMKVVSVMQQFIKSTLEEDVSEAEGR